MSNIVRERNKRLRNIAERFVEKEVMDTVGGILEQHECDKIVKSLTTVLDNVDQYARRDKAYIPDRYNPQVPDNG